MSGYLPTKPLLTDTDFQDALVAQLAQTNQFEKSLANFELLHEHSEQVKNALNLLKQYHIVHKPPFRRLKSDTESVALRKIGNEQFAAKKFFQALKSYNKSICLAEKDTENLSIGYANRSAVYFEWRMFAKCLENIRLAKQANCPARLLPKLEKRSEKCMESEKCVESEKKPELIIMELTYPPDCLKVAENDAFGRHIIANRDLKVGDIVMLEPPYQSRLHSDYNYQRCVNCLVENSLSLIPCPECTSTMYCSPQCLSIGYVKFHKYECPVIDSLSELDIEPLLIAARLLLTMIDEFKSIEILNTVVQENNDRASKNYYSQERNKMSTMFHSLANNMEKYSNQEMFWRSVSVATLYNLFSEHTDLKAMLDRDSHEDIFLNLLFRYVHTCKTNGHPLAALEFSNEKEIETKNFGTGVFLMSSLINHSCAPNLARVFGQDSQMGLMVIRPIKKSGQLLVSYGVHHMVSCKKDRQEKLQNVFKFACCCEACVQDYPMAVDLPYADSDHYQLFDYKEAVQRFKNLKVYLEKHDGNYPCRKIWLFQQAMPWAFRTCCGNYSLNTKKKQ